MYKIYDCICFRNIFEYILNILKYFKYLKCLKIPPVSSKWNLNQQITFRRENIPSLCIIKKVMMYPFTQKPKFQTRFCNPTLVLLEGSLACILEFYLTLSYSHLLWFVFSLVLCVCVNKYIYFIPWIFVFGGRRIYYLQQVGRTQGIFPKAVSPFHEFL